MSGRGLVSWMPEPSTIVMMESADTFASVSIFPLGQRISTDSIFADLPRPKWRRRSF